MNSIIIFNGFQTVKFMAEVVDKHTIQRHGLDVLCGTVSWKDKAIHVEWVGKNEWWGRTT